MSTNPYAQPAARAASPAASPEQQQSSDYQLAVGPNNDYYLPKFEEFDKGGSQSGWHWPAFIVTSWWFLYRKMFAVGILNLFYPLLALIVFSIVMAVAKPPAAVATILAIVLLFAPSIVLSMYANALYWRHVRKVIRNVPSSFAPDKRAARIERNGGTGVGPMLAVMLGAGFFGLSILAGITIPIYRDFTIRAQIIEGTLLASPIKRQFEEFYAQNQRWPENLQIGAAPTGKYVDSVEVSGGSIVITYGGAAYQKIRGQHLAFQPTIDASGEVKWVCGSPDREIADKYLPSYCKSGT